MKTNIQILSRLKESKNLNCMNDQTLTSERKEQKEKQKLKISVTAGLIWIFSGKHSY